MFTEEEVKAAKATREAIIKGDVAELKSIYMAGEICMWDEMQSRQAAVSGSLPPIEVEKCYPDLHPSYWIASWKAFPGMVVQAETREDVINELMTSIRVKLLYDLSLAGGGNDR